MFAARGGFLYQSEPVSGWNVSTAVYSGVSLDITTQSVNMQGLYFRPDGLKMYTTSVAGDSVYEYNLSSGWDISTASFVQALDVSTQDISPTDVSFKPDGTKMYMCGSGNDRVYEYNLSSAWNISTASYVQFYSVAAQEGTLLGMYFRDDGAKFYITGSSSDRVYEYDVSTPWNISTTSLLQSFLVSGQDTNPQDVYFKPDGTKMYVIGSTTDTVYQYTLGTAWNVSTASLDQSFSIASQTTSPADVAFNDNGTKMFVISNSNSTIYEYTL